MEEWLRAQPEVKTVSMTLGSTPPRAAIWPAAAFRCVNFSNILVELRRQAADRGCRKPFNAYVTANFPDVWLRSSLFKLSPVPDAAIEFGFIGDDVDTLRRLTAGAERGDVAHPGAVNIRNSWGNRVPTWLPLYSQMKGQRIGVTRSQMAQGITIATQGYTLGEYREGDQFMPILLKDENIGSVQPDQFAGAADLHAFGQRSFRSSRRPTVPFRYRPGVMKAFQPPAGDEGAMRPGPRVNTMELFAALRDSVDRAVPLPEAIR